MRFPKVIGRPAGSPVLKLFTSQLTIPSIFSRWFALVRIFASQRNDCCGMRSLLITSPKQRPFGSFQPSTQDFRCEREFQRRSNSHNAGLCCRPFFIAECPAYCVTSEREGGSILLKTSLVAFPEARSQPHDDLRSGGTHPA